MKKVTIELANCYGIGKLSCEFDFSGGPVHSVYAPNGFMKTSLARTLRDLSLGKPSSDQMFPERTTRREIRDELGVEIPGEQILVIPPYEEDFQPKQASLLLVEASLKARYDTAIAQIEDRKAALLTALKARSGIQGRSITPETELVATFGVTELLDGLTAMEEAAKAGDSAWAGVDYGVVFSEKAVQFLSGRGALAEIDAYVKQFDELVSQSPILTAQFTHTQAQAVQKSLADSKFFDANHWITLRDAGEDTEIRDVEQLRKRVESELQRVLADPKLRKAFDAFDKKISANSELRQLRDYLRKHREFLPHLKDIPTFRRGVWAAFLAAESTLLRELLTKYAANREVMEEVVREAREQATDWVAVVDLFNERFMVPFRLTVENQADVILKEAAPRVAFKFVDPDGEVSVPSSRALLQALSQGERRALYLLNVLFEIHVRRKSRSATLIVVDDIADSFDYRNKYAIIEYLQDVARVDEFRLIILTHNFDFHRSAAGRLGLLRDNRRLAVRSGREVSLERETYQKNPLTHWKEHPEDARKFLASVPFVRNLAEYCGHEASFEILTEVLHLKSTSSTLTLAALDREYEKVLKNYVAPASPARTTLVSELIDVTAQAISSEVSEHAELDAKIVLSIAIRLKAEKYMISAIKDPAFVADIRKNQTQQLLERYRTLFGHAAAPLRVLNQVQLMTPENIHLNSFMYEPILDLGIGQLKRLYEDVRAL